MTEPPDLFHSCALVAFVEVARDGRAVKPSGCEPTAITSGHRRRRTDRRRPSKSHS
jgi:hypothetical protein